MIAPVPAPVLAADPRHLQEPDAGPDGSNARLLATATCDEHAPALRLEVGGLDGRRYRIAADWTAHEASLASGE